MLLVSLPECLALVSFLRHSLKHNLFYCFRFKVEDEFRDEMQNILFLKRAVLGVSAVEGERNMIEVNAAL